MKSSRLRFDVAVHRSPEELAADPGPVHLWLLDLDDERLVDSFLAADELDRVGRLKDPVFRRRSSRRFALSRRVLANLFGIQPRDVSFVYGVCGKPKVVPVTYRASQAGPRFNLAHSENALAIAVAFGLDIGVDVEVLDRSMGSQSFYEEWTLKEAVAKLAGVGITGAARARDLRFAARTLRLDLSGRELAVSIAAAPPSELPDPYQGVLPEEAGALGVPGIDGAGD